MSTQETLEKELEFTDKEIEVLKSKLQDAQDLNSYLKAKLMLLRLKEEKNGKFRN